MLDIEQPMPTIEDFRPSLTMTTNIVTDNYTKS